MAVKVLKGHDVLRESFNLNVSQQLLLEHWKTLELEIKKTAKAVIKDWIATKAIKKDSYQSEFNSILYYFSAFEDGDQREDNFFKIYDVNGYKIPILLNVTKNEAPGDGGTFQYPPHIISAYIEEPEFIDIVKNRQNKSVAYQKISQLIEIKKSTLVHELTHYFQLRNKKIDANNFNVRNSNIGINIFELEFFCYFVEQHELDALLNEAYTTFSSNKRKGKTFFDSLVYHLFRRLTQEDLAINFFKGNVPFKEVFNRLSSVIKFTIEWIIAYYVPTHSKYKYVLEKEMRNENKIVSNPNLLNDNKIRFVGFYKQLNNKEKENLNNFVSEKGEETIYSKIFSTTKPNNMAIQLVQNVITR